MVTAFFDNIRAHIISELDQAEKSVWAAIYWFTNYELFKKLMEKLEDGVEVKLIVHNDYINNRDTGLPFQQLINNGCKFYFSDERNPMHNKFCLIDNKTIINGSYNWTYYAESKNRENILIIKEEDHVVDAFQNEFNRLLGLLDAVKTVELLTRFEVHENDQLNAREYLAHDLLYQAKDTNQPQLIKKAFELTPNNLNVQRIANDLNLIKKYRLKHSIVVSLINDGVKLIAQKGASIPASYSTIVRTAYNNQPKSETDILYGENSKASLNTLIKKLVLDQLPNKPAGEAKVKLTITLNIRGEMRIEKLSLDTGNKVEFEQDANWLIEEITQNTN